MFFILSKTIFYIVMPMVWITSILLFAVFTKNQKRKKVSVILALILLLFFSNDFISNEFFSLWEEDPVLIEQMENYDLAIVLTGITNNVKENKDRVYFQKGADRLLHTIQLYKLGKVKRILVTGGSGRLIGEKVAEADQLKKVFLYCGVPEKDIILESRSRNTHENALFTKNKIDSLGIKGKFLLVTSAFHMKRSMGCFKKEGIQVDIFPVDFYTRDRKFTPNILFIPSEGAMCKWAVLIHEILGYIMYKFAGYC